MRTSSRSVAVVLFDEVELLDVAGALSVLSAAGRQWNYRPFKVHTVGTRSGLVETRSQVRLEARRTLDELQNPEIVIVPGGYGARRALADASLIGWLKVAGKTATHLLGVGNGVLLLAAASLVDGQDVCAVQEIAESLGEGAAPRTVDTDARFRQSGPLFTAKSSASATDAALALVSAILGAKQARTVAESLGIPFAAPEKAGEVAIAVPDRAGEVAIIEKS